ncbi:MAG: DUF2461 domain-containing protein [Prevotella sp.]|nr:DUF2461 domain-containing protein [Prevotella sp.]
MQIERILKFLKEVAANNNREWFAEHKGEYLACKADFEDGVAKAIARIAEFDPNVAHLMPKDCCYRFYRDVRFSEDKSPYKRHFGAYICEKGKKSLRAGYYIHVQPGRCFLSCGAYWLPTNILTACRNEIMGNIDEWRKCVENGQFIKLYGYPGEGIMSDEELSEKGFGLVHLKTCPKDFPRDYEYMSYLRMKDYAVWHRVEDKFFEGDVWLDDIVRMFKVAKPMNYFVNAVIADYD